ncbi:MAG TPA: glutaminyl-peptide cyclotransferase [Longimicrobiaceae bacterium]|nr:glutaminyl-peptide cyclotransferase [Longimicrobiaceae bacterium]
MNRFLRPGRGAVVLTLGLAAFCGCKGSDAKNPPLDQPPQPVAPVASADVIRSFPHDTAAYTQGLVWNGTGFYESTGRVGFSSLRRVELETGKVLQKQDVPAPHFAEGLALFGGKLYQLTWQDQEGYIYDPVTFHRVGSFTYQGEGWGLATDGRSLILSDGSNQLRYLDPRTWAEQRVVNVMDGTEYVNDLNELEWVKGEVWANVWHTNRIARIDPATGKVKAWVDLTGVMAPQPDAEAVLNGIAYDQQHDRLFITGKLWPSVFEIAVRGVAGGGGAAAGETARPAVP